MQAVCRLKSGGRRGRIRGVELKSSMDESFSRMGLSIPGAVDMYIHRLVPFFFLGEKGNTNCAFTTFSTFSLSRSETVVHFTFFFFGLQTQPTNQRFHLHPPSLKNQLNTPESLPFPYMYLPPQRISTIHPPIHPPITSIHTPPHPPSLKIHPIPPTHYHTYIHISSNSFHPITIV